MVAVSMVVLLAIVGLVVDAGLAYMVKARLNAAVDSAALAAARAVPVGNNQTEQRANAQAASAQFFAANIPSNYLLSTPNLLSTTVTFDAGMVTIDVRAEAPMPVSFMQVLGFSSLKPVAYAQTIRKDLDMALVIDTSGSLSGSASTVRASAKTFLNKFNVLQDRVGMIHFASGFQVDNAINTGARGFNRTSMLANIDKLQFTGVTNSVEGMWQARNQLNLIPSANRSSLRVIVFFSDGAPTALGSTFTFNSNAQYQKACSSTVGVLDNSASGLYSLAGSAIDTIDDCPATAASGRYYYPFYYTSKLPDYYNAHDTLREFPVVTPGAFPTRRAVTADITNTNYSVGQRNVDRAARNLAEAVAAKARDENIYVFTLGLGSGLKDKSPFDNEVNEDVLKCMANVADGPASCYNPAKPVGMYCFAATEADLTPCFSRLASAILRISK